MSAELSCRRRLKLKLSCALISTLCCHAQLPQFPLCPFCLSFSSLCSLPLCLCPPHSASKRSWLIDSTLFCTLVVTSSNHTPFHHQFRPDSPFPLSTVSFRLSHTLLLLISQFLFALLVSILQPQVFGTSYPSLSVTSKSFLQILAYSWLSLISASLASSIKVLIFKHSKRKNQKISLVCISLTRSIPY